MTEHSIIRFKYLLGELLLATWQLQLLRIDRPYDADETWPSQQDISVAASSSSSDDAGIWFRQVAPERFTVGFEYSGQWLRYVPRVERLYYVELKGSFADYMARRSAKSRYNIKRSIKILQQANSNPILEVVTDAGEMERFHRTAVAISRTTYQAKLLNVGLPNTPQFLSDMQARASRGEARGYLLKDQGEAIAFAWCTAVNSRITYEVIGYLPHRASLSPGTVLLSLIIEDLFDLARYQVFDFGVGEAFYKAAFATTHIDYADAFMLRSTMGKRIAVRAHWHLDQLSSRIGRWLERNGLKKKVKKLIRRFSHADN